VHASLINRSTLSLKDFFFRRTPKSLRRNQWIVIISSTIYITIKIVFFNLIWWPLFGDPRPVRKMWCSRYNYTAIVNYLIVNEHTYLIIGTFDFQITHKFQVSVAALKLKSNERFNLNLPRYESILKQYNIMCIATIFLGVDGSLICFRL
jgi:hypothetical protein